MQFSWIVSLEFIYSCPFYFPPMIDFFVSLFLDLQEQKQIEQQQENREKLQQQRRRI
jgi:hypothetical protein